MENVRNKKKIEFIKNDKKDIITQQAKSIFNGIGISDENYDNYTFKQNETLMDQQICLGFAIIELSNLLMYETYYAELQPYFGEKSMQSHCFDTDSFVISIKTKDINKDSKILGTCLNSLNRLNWKFEWKSRTLQ